MMCWCLKLAAYDHNQFYRAANQNQNDDALSRLPMLEVRDEEDPLGDVLMLKH